jgi:hypothetical protein
VTFEITATVAAGATQYVKGVEYATIAAGSDLRIRMRLVHRLVE